MVQDMDKETGDHQETEVTFMLECTKMIRNVGMGDMFGPMDVFMKETLKTISSNHYLI